MQYGEAHSESIFLFYESGKLYWAGADQGMQRREENSIYLKDISFIHVGKVWKGGSLEDSFSVLLCLSKFIEPHRYLSFC